MTKKTKKTKMTKKTKKTEKNYYSFIFKSGDYFHTSRMLEDRYPTLFDGCGFRRRGNDYDIGFYCTEAQAREIAKYISRSNLPKAKIHKHIDVVERICAGPPSAYALADLAGAGRPRCCCGQEG